MSRPASPGPPAGPQALQQSYYRERDANNNLTQAPPQMSSHYRDMNGYPVVKTSGHVTRESRHPSAPPPPASSSHNHGHMNSKNRGLPYARTEKDYHAMYKDLKVKVSDIENENDRLYYKILQAKRNIQRAKLERAILYERLGQLPASPIPVNSSLPPPFSHPSDFPQQGRHREREAFYPQPIQPTPASASHTSPPIALDHQGPVPITHAQQLVTVQLPEGPVVVVAGPDGKPVIEHGRYIFANDVAPVAPGHAGAPAKRRGGRVSKEVREMREKEAMRMREREREMQDAAVVMTDMRSAAPPLTSSSSTLGPQQTGASDVGMPPSQTASSSRSMQNVEMDWERERAPSGGVAERSSPPPPPSSGHRHVHHHHHHHSHGAHVHRAHSQSQSDGPTSPGGVGGVGAHAPHSSRRIHGHQRVGPGSYVIRDARSPSSPGTLPPGSAGVSVDTAVPTSADAPMPMSAGPASETVEAVPASAGSVAESRDGRRIRQGERSRYDSDRRSHSPFTAPWDHAPPSN